MAKKKKRKTKLKLARLAHSKGLSLPTYQSKQAAGMDLVAAVGADQPIKLKPGMRALIPTGLCFELPKGFEAQVRPRSGLALKHGVTVLNTPGTIDSDYRGEVQVILVNLGTKTFTVARGERIAQVVIAPVVQIKIKSSKKLAKTKRGSGGFGSTGTSADESKTKTSPRTKSKAKIAVRPKRKATASPRSKTPSRTRSPARNTSQAKPPIAAKSKPRTPVKRKPRSQQKPRIRLGSTKK